MLLISILLIIFIIIIPTFFFFEVFCPFYFQKSEKWTFSKCPKTDFPNLEWAKNFKKKNLDDNALKPISKKFSL